MSERQSVRKSSRSPKPTNKMIQYKDSLKDGGNGGKRSVRDHDERSMKDVVGGSMKNVGDRNAMNYVRSNVVDTGEKENFRTDGTQSNGGGDSLQNSEDVSKKIFAGPVVTEHDRLAIMYNDGFTTQFPRPMIICNGSLQKKLLRKQ